MTLKLNGIEIPEPAIQFELDRLVQFYSQHLSPAELGNQMDVLKQKARDQAVGGMLLMAEATKIHFEIPGSDIEAKVKTMTENAGGPEAFQQILKNQGMTDVMVRSSIENGMRVDMLIEKITEGVGNPSEDDMHAHFEEHKHEYAQPYPSHEQPFHHGVSGSKPGPASSCRDHKTTSRATAEGSPSQGNLSCSNCSMIPHLKGRFFVWKIN